MSKRIALFWPGDAREKPNELARPAMLEATKQLTTALQKLGKEPYLVEGFLSKPHESIEKLGPVRDPMIGVCTHWFYGPHTTDGVVGKDNPLLLASNFSAAVARPRRPAEHRRVPGDASAARFRGRGPTQRGLDDRRRVHGAPREQWCSTGRIAYAEDELHYHAPISRRRPRRSRSGRRADPPPPRPRPDARRHVDGHDQRLLRPAPAESARLHGAQGRPGVDHRPRSPHRGASGSTPRSRS